MRLVHTAVAALLTLGAGIAQAQWPSKPIKVIVPFTPGSATDIVARSVGERLSPRLGQPLIVENKPGAGGTIGTAQVAQAIPDGYTILVQSSAHTVNPWIYDKLPYDTARDFAGVTPLASLPNVLIIAPAKGIKSVRALVDAAKASPGSLTYASAGTGSATHMNAEKFRAAAGIDAVHVPFKGTPEGITEVMTGRVDYFFAPIVSAMPQLRDGKLLALAVGSPRRSAILPDIPTTVEAGIVGSDYTFWVGMLVSAKVPREVVARLNAETTRVLDSPDMKERLAKLGAEPLPMTSGEFDTYIHDELAANQRLIKAAGLKAQ